MNDEKLRAARRQRLTLAGAVAVLKFRGFNLLAAEVDKANSVINAEIEQEEQRRAARAT